MKCPKCNEETKHNQKYDMYLCKNKDCSLYLKDDIRNKKPTFSPNKNYQPKIKEIINEFNFDKVQKVMDFLDWRWQNARRIPTIHELISKSENLLNDVCLELLNGQEKEWKVSTGGFSAYGFIDDSGDIELSLSFCIEEWETYF